MKTLLMTGVFSLLSIMDCSDNQLLFPTKETFFYASIDGSDSHGDGSKSNPWRTLAHALSKVQADKNHNIKLSAGYFVEKSYINVPSGVNIEGEGPELTVIRAHPSLFYKFPKWTLDKFLLSFSDAGGRQKIKNLTVDGNSKQLYGGIIVKNRRNVIIQNVKVQHCYYTGIWMWNTNNCRVTKVILENNAYGDERGASASIILTAGSNLEVDNLQVDEEYGQALDVTSGKLHNVSIHHNNFSVSPKPNWVTADGHQVPNICVEFFNADLVNAKIYNNYFDNSLSIVKDSKAYKRTGVTTARIYNNVFDLVKRAKGEGYGIELTVDDVEINNNYFLGGSTGIVNWENAGAPLRQGWKIHHNVFYHLSSPYPTGIINFFQTGINGALIYNNTAEMTGTSTVSFIEASNGGTVRNTKVENNLIINSNTDYMHYPNKFINLYNASAYKVSVKNNFLEKMSLDKINNVEYVNNIIGKSQILKSGKRPNPYYIPRPNSPLVDAGIVVGSSFLGAAPDIGAFEAELDKR